VAPTGKLSTASTLPSELQAIAFLTEETGECGEQELNHSDGQAEKFYRDLMQRGICMRVDMGATGYSRWFERLLAELLFVLHSHRSYQNALLDIILSKSHQLICDGMADISSETRRMPKGIPLNTIEITNRFQLNFPTVSSEVRLSNLFSTF
jgi:hypothetical protein